jgi:hypothetical protein
MNRFLSTVVLLTMAGCGSGTDVELTMADVAGSYEATTLTTTSGSTTDHLAQGSEIAIVLMENGTTTGRMFIVGGDEDGGDYDVDLTGTWSLSGRTVEFSHDADTFLRDMPFAYSDGRLSGTAVFGTEVEAVLTRQ